MLINQIGRRRSLPFHSSALTLQLIFMDDLPRKNWDG